jgi:CRP-like cAMP-binding protein
VVDIEQRIAFLKKIHLFHGLSDEQLAAVAAELKEAVYPAQALIFSEGSPGDTFFLIFGGRVTVSRKRKEKEELLAALVKGDYFGEEALLTNRRRSAAVRVQEEVLLFCLPRQKFILLLKKIPQLKPNFQISVESRKLARSLRFKWVRPDEVIYFLARKHIILFFEAALRPALLAGLSALLIIGFLFVKLTILLLLAGLSLLVFIGWLVWDWIDWGNDYYIVTNQRVIWLEKVVGLYDSRQEAPLTTVLSVGTETEPLGRSLDYGNVIIRTFVGRIPFHHVAHPYQAAALVQEHWSRSKEGSHRSEVDAMKKALQTRVQPNQEQTVSSASAPAGPPVKIKKPRPASAPGENLIGDLFKLRFEEREIITYRKHWFILIRQVWLPTLLGIGLFAGLGLGISYLFISSSAAQNPALGAERGTFFVVWAVAFLIVLAWEIYQYVDWANDIYQVTPEQILDIERKPLGSEERTAAQLENILATEYERRGILGLFLNYGTVHITVGGTKMTFKDVFDPPSVQQDIDRRRLLRKNKTEEARVVAERERLADWFQAYDELQKSEPEKPPSKTE